ncbi:MAG: hypothetical protein J6Q58_05805 [Clostridia bacterium]|nr:hypothetical protein [Clostridia bacterium]
MFCKICGNELHEKAVACPKCGCAVETTVITKKPQESCYNENQSKAFIIFNYITIGLICLALMCFALSMADSGVSIYDSYYDYYATFYLEEDWLSTSFIVSLLALGSSITAFVLGFKKDNANKRFLSDVLFIVALCVFFVATYSGGLYLF